MPRGNKLCPKCQGNNGPRSFFCKHCNEPFVIKGKKMERKQRRVLTANKPDELKDLFVKSEHHIRKLKNREAPVKFWESRADDDNYFIMYTQDYDGVIMPDGRKWKLCEHVNPVYEGGSNHRVIGRFRSFTAAARRYSRIKKGLPPRKSKKKRTLDERIDAHMKRARRALS